MQFSEPQFLQVMQRGPDSACCVQEDSELREPESLEWVVICLLFPLEGETLACLLQINLDV